MCTSVIIGPFAAELAFRVSLFHSITRYWYHGTYAGRLTVVMAQGKSSKDFVTELGYLGEEEIVHRDNICLLSQRKYQANFSEANLNEHGDAQEQGAWIFIACMSMFVVIGVLLV